MAVEPTIAVPAGLDVMTPDEQRLMDSMRADDPGAPAAPEPPTRKTVQKTKEAAPEPPEPALDAEVDLDAGSEPDAPTDHRVKMVPHAQFHAANERRKAAEVKAQDAAVKLAAVEARKLLAQGIISYDKAIETVKKYTDFANLKAQQVAKRFGVKAKRIDPRGFLR